MALHLIATKIGLLAKAATTSSAISAARVFWYFNSLKSTMFDKEAMARMRFDNVSNNCWLAALLDLAELKHAPKKAGDCWLAGKALDNRLLDRPALNHQGYQL